MGRVWHEVPRRAPTGDRRRQPGYRSCPACPARPEAVRRLRVRVAQGGGEEARGQSLVPRAVQRRRAGRLRDAVVAAAGRSLPGRHFIWRLLVDKRYQGRGIGREALAQIAGLVRADGTTELLTSYEPGDGEPWPFHQKFGFEPTGEIDDGEIVLRLTLAPR
ncbi:GNAT family N-acetyltransferase [Streptomyces sp. NPDC096012]|uniref:GNAT family N-acetyltransferase n=1 Tax=Streptomyces sp. NPDC096012 TaxID=3155684 RepID=UPI00336ADDA5